MNPDVDQYLKQGCMRCELGATPECKVHLWSELLVRLRGIILSSGLKEEFKWSQPCYTHEGSNVLILTAFKNYACISFFKGALLRDQPGLLIKPGENSRAARQLRFTRMSEIEKQENDIRSYIEQAIMVEEEGLKVDFEATRNIDLPEEFIEMMEENPALRTAFEALTPGRQRGYSIYFSGAKKASTRISRIEKYLPKIYRGLGIHDR
jgi:uncharacterized protein YdeI (YjbR/CyaY-like superfamily)